MRHPNKHRRNSQRSKLNGLKALSWIGPGIDKADIASINKFTYLCGLLGWKVKSAVEALPFTSEGYNRAKSILQSRYGKESEIVKAYAKLIMDLPVITSANPKKIREFSEKFSYCVRPGIGDDEQTRASEWKRTGDVGQVTSNS